MKPGYALITGGAQRLGRAMSLALAQDGWAVAIHYNTSGEDAAALVEQIGASGGRAVAVQADLLDAAATAALIGRARDALGGALTLLVNNASIFEYDNFETATLESWDRHIGSNLRAPFQLTQAFAAQAPDTVTDVAGEPVAQAAIVNMCDMRVRKLTPEFTTYTIAKSALWTMTQTAEIGRAHV